MPVSPNVILNSPGITVQAVGGVTYEELINALGSFNFRVDSIKINALQMNQVHQILQYDHYNSNGNRMKLSVVPNIDPYQSQPAINIETREHDIILDGRSSINFDVMPNENILMILHTEEISLTQMLNSISQTNLQRMIERMR